MSFAERLRTVRNSKGYSQEQLAELLEVSRQSIAKWESETGYPEMKKALLLVTELSTSLDWLFEEELEKLGWKALADKKNNTISAEEKNMSQHKVNKEMVEETINKLYSPALKGTMTTGILELDELEGGFLRGDVYHLIGKIVDTEVTINIVQHYLRNNKTVLYVLKKGTVQETLRKLICVDANVSFYTKHKPYTKIEDRRVQESALFMKDANLIFNDSYDESLDRLYEKCIHSKEQLDLVVIDSKNLLHTVSDKENQKNRIRTILQSIARECRCAVLVLQEVDNATEKLLRHHEQADIIIRELWNSSYFSYTDPIILAHSDDLYKAPDGKVNRLSLIYSSGYHGKGIRMIEKVYDIETGKIYSKEVCKS